MTIQLKGQRFFILTQLLFSTALALYSIFIADMQMFETLLIISKFKFCQLSSFV
ncbi:hypothetical protein FD20_GL001108 [Liquorilactobacillus uvarum DSM 19971]|uniref:Uncharacterized protein n=1 Tax=Liquorilactobacillus uvarum DSM 19971 TaxID=1423812 RepID=A0A0R1Q3K9_9LACO|nr:hypothetical protein FD20_GL001108 [Liquorilactobacillus uvarum DSM 19971]